MEATTFGLYTKEAIVKSKILLQIMQQVTSFFKPIRALNQSSYLDV